MGVLKVEGSLPGASGAFQATTDGAKVMLKAEVIGASASFGPVKWTVRQAVDTGFEVGKDGFTVQVHGYRCLCQGWKCGSFSLWQQVGVQPLVKPPPPPSELRGPLLWICIHSTCLVLLQPTDKASGTYMYLVTFPNENSFMYCS